MTSLPQSSNIVTTFLISNLHCPSCVNNIQQILKTLHSSITIHSCSIVSHSVSLQHKKSSSVFDIAIALENAGFQIESVAQDQDGQMKQLYEQQDGDRQNPKDRLSNLHFEPWQSETARQDTQWMRKEAHYKRCEECQAAQKLANFHEEDEKRAISAVDGHYDISDGVSTFVVPTSPDSLMHSIVAVEGMSCSSCVGKIIDELESKPWINGVEVSLLSGTASVKYCGIQHLPEIIEALEDIGFDAAVERTIDPTATTKNKTPGNRWQAIGSIKGMSCSACITKISSFLNKLAWVESTDVSLVSQSIKISFSGKEHVEEIPKLISELGDYHCDLQQLESLDSSQSTDANQSRKMIINIEGMHCPACPERVTEALESLDSSLRVEEPVNLNIPRVRVTYTPRPPYFTIRDILAKASSIDPSFHVSIYHPPTLEDRAREIQKKHRFEILYRLLLTFIVAIPTLIIGITFMMIVPESNKTRQFFEEPILSGNVSRGEWAAFFLTTPVYFFAADLFHRRTLKELWLSWKPGSKTPVMRRFYKFGSMDSLISLGTSVAYFTSIAQLCISATSPRSKTGQGHSASFFDAVVFLTLFLLCGRLIEALSKAKASNAVALLGNLRPTEAHLIVGNETIISPTDRLENGDVVRVNLGASPPCDGTIIEGLSKFDESSLTGEAKAVEKTTGDTAYTGTLNKGSPVLIRVTGVGGQSMLDQIINVVRDGQTRRAPVERLADILTSYFVPVITFIAIVVWLTWLSLGLSGSLPEDYLDVEVGSWTFWSLQFAIAVFVIACPCGIGLAAPTAIFVGTGLGAKHGVLVKSGGEAFQMTSKINCIVFDKTGTLTMGGNPVVTDELHLEELQKPFYLGMAKAVEEASSHPLAKAVVSSVDAQEHHVGTLADVDEIPGKGMKGRVRFDGLVDGQKREFDVLLGNETLMLGHVYVPADVTAVLVGWKKQAKSVILMASREVIATSPDEKVDSTLYKLAIVMAASDPIRPESAKIVRKFQEDGLETWMLSGDNAITARAVAAAVGIPDNNVIAGVLPDQKAAKIQYLQQSPPAHPKSRGLHGLGFLFRRLFSSIRLLFLRTKSTSLNNPTASQPSPPSRRLVAMVGDGINDSPALTAADIGLAVGSGAEIAIAAADFVLVAPGLQPLLTAFELSRKVFWRIKFNFGWALVYNTVGVPIAAGVLYPLKDAGGQHIRLDPVWASLAMALSSVSVVVSSLALRSRVPGFGFRASKVMG